ncbi:FadR/GntR family transcriptional regulator [Streptomyces sp. NPDC004266]|uniref:FadR/GntR family transcriptional regulator n=1 Tax=Streptomyces sp. NPDC004266 TaxID=3364693 RepID=UPI00368430CA
MGERTVTARVGRPMLRQEVSEGIKRYILDHHLKPGDPLPTESQLCDVLGASRSSVREAVKMLNALDIVDVRHGHGTYVGRLSLSALVESLAFRGLLDPGDNCQVLADLVEVRQLFESGMADQIVARLDEGHLDELDRLVDAMRTQSGGGSGDRAAGLVEVDRAFHAALVRPLGNELIGKMSTAFWDVYEIVAPQLSLLTPADEVDIVAIHQDIVTAARAGDTDGFVAAVVAHYAPLRRRIRESAVRPRGDGEPS